MLECRHWSVGEGRKAVGAKGFELLRQSGITPPTSSRHVGLKLETVQKQTSFRIGGYFVDFYQVDWCLF